MKKIIVPVLFVLCALLPTYFIIFNTINASGLPEFERQEKVLVTFPPSEGNQRLETYTAEDKEFRLLTSVLSYLTPEDALPESVADVAYYTFLFTNDRGVENECRLYTDPDQLRTYLVSERDKVFRLATPSLYDGSRRLLPTFIQYAVPALVGPLNTSQIIEAEITDFRKLAFDFTEPPTELIIQGYLSDGETLVGTYDAFSKLPASVEVVMVAASFRISETLSYSVGYTLVR